MTSVHTLSSTGLDLFARSSAKIDHIRSDDGSSRTAATSAIPLSPKPETRRADRIWSSLRRDARSVAESDPTMARFVTAAVLDHNCLEDAIAYRVAERLDAPLVGAAAIRCAFDQALADDRSIGRAMARDIAAVFERDPACERFIEPLLYFKGFHAIQTHRLAHWLWLKGRTDFALWLQSRASAVFQTDINPAARIGQGIFLDHATGLVIGGTAVVGDDVSILHDVTLGGTGKESGDRHPKVGCGVLIGAGAKILGNITVGTGAKVAAGSMVLHPVPPHVTVAGVPAAVVGKAGRIPPARTMDQTLGRRERASRSA